MKYTINIYKIKYTINLYTIKYTTNVNTIKYMINVNMIKYMIFVNVWCVRSYKKSFYNSMILISTLLHDTLYVKTTTSYRPGVNSYPVSSPNKPTRTSYYHTHPCGQVTPTPPDPSWEASDAIPPLSSMVYV